MSSSSSCSRNPLLQQEIKVQGCVNKVIDVDEAKDQILFALPMVVTYIAYYSIPLVSIMFAGHLGEHQLAASTLANSWAVVSGFAFMVI